MKRRIAKTEVAILEGGKRLGELRTEQLDHSDASDPLTQFDELWTSLALEEQQGGVDMLIETFCYDGQSEDLLITYRPSGFHVFRFEMARMTQRTQEHAPY